MKVGDSSGVAPVGRGTGATLLTGPGWSVITRGEFLVLRAMPALTGKGIAEVSLSETQMAALRDGDVTVEELLLRDVALGRLHQSQVSLSDAAQRAAQSGLVPGAGGGRSGASAGAGRNRAPAYDHRLTAAALVFAAGVLLFILFGG